MPCDLHRAPVCLDCLTAANFSRADVAVQPSGLLQVFITSGVAGCARRSTGGDVWIVRWETQSGHHGAMWRSRAKDLGNGSYTYLASLPASLLMNTPLHAPHHHSALTRTGHLLE